jgi:hypothetical protein
MSEDQSPQHTDSRPLERAVLTRVLRLNAVVQGIVLGFLAGLVVFLATNWLVIKGGRVVGPHLSLLGQYFVGYRVTFLGSLIGFAYAFVLGFLAGYFIARVYNALVDGRERWRARRSARSRGEGRDER